MGSVHCRSDATRELRQLMATGVEFHQNVRSVMYCAALRSGSSNDFHFVWDRMLTTNDTTRRNQLISALGCSSTPQLLRELLRSTLSATNDNGIEYGPGDAYRVFNTVYQNGLLGLEMALDFLIANTQDTFDEFGFTNFENIIIGKGRLSMFVETLNLKKKFFWRIGMSQRVSLAMRERVKFKNQNLSCSVLKIFFCTTSVH